MKIKPAYFFLFLLTALSFLGASQTGAQEEEAVVETATSAGSVVVTISPSPVLELPPVPTPTPVSPNANFLTISPPVRELELSPGSTNSYQLSLTNQGEQKVRLILRASPFTAAGETGGVDVADEELPDSQNWVIINPAVLDLEPGERAEVVYTISLPQKAQPGGFYFALTALLAGENISADALGRPAGGAAVNLNVASLHLVRIAGPVNFAAQVSEFSTPKTIYEYGPVPFSARILNQSNVHIKPVLEIEVKNTLGLADGELIHLPQQNILPQAGRKYEAEFGGKWHFGRYAATLNGLYGDGQTLTYTIFFWILPWKIMLAVALALAIIILLVISIKRQLDEKKLLEAEVRHYKKEVLQKEEDAEITKKPKEEQ